MESNNAQNEDSSFSKETAYILLRAGWYANRETNIDVFVHALESDGYEVFPDVRNFLRQFGGLEIHYDFRLENDPSRVWHDSMHFNASKATAAVHPEIVNEYAQFLNTSLCPIGECNSNQTTIMMDSQGKVYGGHDDLIIYFGDSGNKAVENLISMKNIYHIRE